MKVSAKILPLPDFMTDFIMWEVYVARKLNGFRMTANYRYDDFLRLTVDSMYAYTKSAELALMLLRVLRCSHRAQRLTSHALE